MPSFIIFRKFTQVVLALALAKRRALTSASDKKTPSRHKLTRLSKVTYRRKKKIYFSAGDISINISSRAFPCATSSVNLAYPETPHYCLFVAFIPDLVCSERLCIPYTRLSVHDEPRARRHRGQGGDRHHHHCRPGSVEHPWFRGMEEEGRGTVRGRGRIE